MKALTLRQPWASLIACGAKTIETRGWHTPHRGPVAIHAGQQLDPAWLSDAVTMSTLVEQNRILGLIPGDGPLPRGCVIATARLVDVVPAAWVVWVTDGPNTRGWSIDDLRSGDFPPPVAVNTRMRNLGDWSAGRWAWLLDNITPLPEPVPATGRQGLWDWTP